MKLSEELANVKNKYTTYDLYDNGLRLLPCHSCKHPETKYCLKCEECGRQFSNDRLVKEGNNETETEN